MYYLRFLALLLLLAPLGVVAAPPENEPLVGLTATPSSITLGNSSTLSWNSSFTTSCTGTGFSTGGARNGSVIVSPTVTTTYHVTCQGTNGESDSASRTVTVTAAPPPVPTASLSATPTSITSGGSSTLTWSSTNATSCTGSGFTAGATSGSTSVSPSATTQYGVTCNGSSSSATAYQTVTVTAPSFSASCTASPSPAATGENVIWSVSVSGGSSSGSSWVNQGTTHSYTKICSAGVNIQQPACSEEFLQGSCTVGSVCVTHNYDEWSEEFGSSAGCVDPNYGGGVYGNGPTIYGPVTAYRCTAPGAPTYTYAWSGTDSLTGTTASINKTYTTTGTKDASVTVTSGGQQVIAQCSVQLQAPACSDGVDNDGDSLLDSADPECQGCTDGTCHEDPPNAGLSCDTSPGSAAVGQSVTYTATSGLGPYTWTPTGGTCTGGTGATNSCTYATPGTYQMQVDTASTPSATCNPSVSIAGECTAGSLSVTATPDRVASGGSATVEWSADAACSCTISGPGLSSSGATGSAAVADITRQSTYTLSCGSASDSATVNIIPRFEEF